MSACRIRTTRFRPVAALPGFASIDAILGPVYLRLLLTGSAVPDRLASGIVDLVLTSARH